MTTHRYGWIPDLPDHRDHRYASAIQGLLAPILPPHVDLRPVCPAIYDQGQLGSCTSNAIAAALEFEQMKQFSPTDPPNRGCNPPFTPSRLFIYYNERVMEGTVDSDAGAMIRDGIKSVATEGDCPETQWPYDISQFTIKPPRKCYRTALKYKVVEYQRVSQDLADMRDCLAAGYPFVFGFTVYQSFESAAVARTGKVPMPKWFERAVGGHAVTAVGYDDPSKRFIVRNSWGDGWGDKGYCTMPYDYLTNSHLADDLWTIRLVMG
jgi:C1A family cysteine protease